MRQGYYLVLPDGARHFIASRVDPRAFGRLCDKHLKESNGWRYWVDYCHGLDVFDRPAWANLDQTDLFLDADARACGAL